MNITVGSLASGIGGLDLGLERAGMTVRWQSEIDPYACRVLAKHWPNIPNLGDIKTIEWSTVERVDLICGGYPCQPFSKAGRRRGVGDPRHLWPHFAVAIRELRPQWALLENVPGHLSLGFGTVLGELADLGYDAEWDCIPAAAVGAPHLRYRVFIVAYPQGIAERPGLRQGQAPTFGWGRLGDCGGENRGWPAEPDVGRVANGVPARLDRLRCLGNAVVPQVAEWVGRRIVAAS